MNAAAATAAVVFVMGAVPFGIGASAIAKRIAYSTSGVPARAVVLEAQRLWLRDFVYPVPRRRFYRLSYEFSVAGGAAVRGEDTYMQSRSLALGPGSHVEVYYLRDDPASSYVVDPYTLFDAVLCAGLGLLLWGGGGWYAWKRRQKLLTAPPPGS